MRIVVYKLLEKVTKMRINHVIKTDQWRSDPPIRLAPHFVPFSRASLYRARQRFCPFEGLSEAEAAKTQWSILITIEQMPGVNGCDSAVLPGKMERGTPMLT